MTALQTLLENPDRTLDALGLNRGGYLKGSGTNRWDNGGGWDNWTNWRNR